eukprot:g8902.t1
MICSGLRRDNREIVGNSLTEVAALPCSPEGLKLRASVALAGGLKSIKTILLTAHGDVRLQCKAVNALTSLLMSAEVAGGFSAAPDSPAVVDRLGDMLRSRSQWAQADAAACLGWLIGHIQGTALHELLPLVTKLMVKHTTTDEEVFLREERQREGRKSRGRNRGGKAGGVGAGGTGGNRRGGDDGSREEDDQALERMDNVRVYTLVFLLKASQADPSTIPAMVEAGAIPGLLRHLTKSAGEEPLSSQQQAEIEQQSPSLVLAARLLYAFSLDPDARASLLEAKALPPLIRLKRKLEAATAAVGAAASSAPLSAEPEPESARHDRAGSVPAALAGKGGLPAERTSRRGERDDEVERVHGDSEQPPLEAMVGLIVHQMFLAVLAMGAFYSFVFCLFLMPPLLAYYAWTNPVLVIPPALAYGIVSYDGTERKEGRPWPTFTESFWVFRLARGYYDFQVYLDPALEPSKMTGDETFIFGLHPHGVLSDYRILLDGVTKDHFPKLRSWRTLAASVLFKFPVWREISLWSHCIDAGRATAQHALSRGHSLFIVPGGEHEQILGEYGKEVLYLKKRMGFVKLALRNGIPLVPAYVFGANDTFKTSTILRRTRLALVKNLRVAFPLFWGRFGLPIPREVPTRVVFGAPLTFALGDGDGDGDGDGAPPSDDAKGGAGRLREVTDEELKKAHGEYVSALRRLFDDNKARFGYADRELVIL